MLTGRRLVLRREALTELSTGELAGLRTAGPEARETLQIKECLVLTTAQCSFACPTNGTTSCAC